MYAYILIVAQVQGCAESTVNLRKLYIYLMHIVKYPTYHLAVETIG